MLAHSTPTAGAPVGTAARSQSSVPVSAAGKLPKQPAKPVDGSQAENRSVEKIGGRQSTVARHPTGRARPHVFCSKIPASKTVVHAGGSRISTDNHRLLGTKSHPTTSAGGNRANPILDRHFPPTQERLDQGPNDHRHATPQRLRPNATTPNRHVEGHTARSPTPRGAVGHHARHPQLVPPSRGAPLHGKVDAVPVSRSRVPGAGHAIRMVPKPILGKQAQQASSGMDGGPRVALHLVRRRCDDPGSNENRCGDQGFLPGFSADGPGRVRERQEVDGTSGAQFHVHGAPGQFGRESARAPTGKAAHSQPAGREAGQGEHDNSPQGRCWTHPGQTPR